MARFLLLALMVAGSLLDGQSLRATPAALPDQYKDFALLAASNSPDDHYALICLRTDVLDAAPDSKQRLLLVAVDPFRVLTEFPVPFGDLLRGHSGHVVKWKPDGSALLMIEQSKWGPGKVYLVPIRAGQAGKVVDLTAEIDRRVEPDFKKSAAERYNDFFAYIFEDGEDMGGGFTWARNGSVAIDCYCTNDPKGLLKKSWNGRYRGTWDVAQGRMNQVSFERAKR